MILTLKTETDESCCQADGLRIVPATIKDAKVFVGMYHRHNRPPESGLFAVGLSDGESLVGVAIAGRPVARALQDGFTVEITRVCTLGHRNANSMMYGAILRAAKALGFRRAITYTLQAESSVSLRAAGFDLDAELAPRPSWNCPARPRTQVDLFGNDTRPPDAKRRWIKRLA